MAVRDYVAWHHEYEQPGSRLHLRLLVVQDLLALALDELPPGPVRVISMCAGQGHDLLTVARRHRRGPDLRGRLVEVDPGNASAAHRTIEQAGLDGLEVVEGDAGRSDSYEGATPADLVLACGVFGNISDEDIETTVRFLPELCSPGAWVVWTRQPEPVGIIERIETWFVDAGFRLQALVVPDSLVRPFGVGAARLVSDPRPLTPGARLFDFVR